MNGDAMSEPMTKEEWNRQVDSLREEMRAQTRAMDERIELDAQHRAEDKAAHAARVDEARRRDDRQLFAGVMATLVGGLISHQDHGSTHLHPDDYKHAAILARRIINEGGTL